jgi:protein SDA1
METHAINLHADVRAKLLTGLILLRNREMIDPLLLLKLSFRLIAIPDKSLRAVLCEYIINDIKTLNNNKRNEKLNRSIQGLLYTIVTEEITTIAALKSVIILSELYRKKIWTDSRTVNVLATACLSTELRVMTAAIQFFLGIETKMYEDELEEKNSLKSKALKDINYHEHSKKTKKRIRQVQKQENYNRKIQKNLNEKHKNSLPIFPAIQLIHNPQILAEKLLFKIKQSGIPFELKLLIMNFVSRLIGCHTLILLNFYR